MSASRTTPRLGLSHVTVVPTNYAPEEDEEGTDETDAELDAETDVGAGRERPE